MRAAEPSEHTLLSRRALLGAAVRAAPGLAAVRAAPSLAAVSTLGRARIAAASSRTANLTSNPHVAGLDVTWNAVARVSKTKASLQVVANPWLRRGSPIHDRAFANLHALGADHVRYVPWYPYPRLGVAELGPPSRTATSWDFREIDPLMVDFMTATEGHAPIIDFSTIPAWMWKTPQPVVPPSNPNAIDFRYMQGTDLAVPLSEVGDYYQRLVSWYTSGGFTDELGQQHRSRHRFKIGYWEVLNEIDAEHALSPQLYTQLYDEIVTRIRTVSPQTECLGLALSTSAPRRTEYIRYFLDPRNHAPGIPLDWISYHFYAIPSSDTPGGWGQTSFPMVDAFLAATDEIETVRTQLSPRTRTAVTEAGTLLRGASVQPHPAPIPPAYWAFSASVYAYLFANLALRGIDVVAESQLLGSPGQFPSVTLLDWRTGLPNARYRVLELLLRHMKPGISLCRSHSSATAFYGLGFREHDGQRKALLVNKGHRPLGVRLQGLRGATIDVVDERSAGGPPRREYLHSDAVVLPGYAVAVARLIRGPHG